jgi:hypothetical protein
MRKSFTILLTIIFLVFFSALTAMILSLSSDTNSTTSKLYLYNQAKLLARSGNEIAVLLIQDRPPEVQCLKTLKLQDGDFNISLNINYIGKFANCPNTIFDNNFSETNGSVIIDVYVETNFEDEHIRFHRRTIQKP